MGLTREEAVRLFHEQWSDMQKELGASHTTLDRLWYKRLWCMLHDRTALNYCFLCEYVRQETARQGIVGIPGIPLHCHMCPIVWPTKSGTCCSKRLADGTFIRCEYYLAASISEILALPERDGGEDG